MKVKKRDGRMQDFDINKIIITIEGASDDAKEPMNESDAELVGRAIERKVNSYNGTAIPVQEVMDIVIEELGNLGFKKIAEAYERGKI